MLQLSGQPAYQAESEKVGLSTRGFPPRSLARPGVRVQAKGRELKKGGGELPLPPLLLLLLLPPPLLSLLLLQDSALAALSQARLNLQKSGYPAKGIQGSFWW